MLRFAILLVLTASAALAGPCTATTLDVYKAADFTCTVGPLTFSAFTSTRSNAKDLSNTDIADTNIDVTIINMASQGKYGLVFSLGTGMAVRGNNGQATGQADIGFNVAGGPIAAAAIRLAGTRDGTGTDSTFDATIGSANLATSAAGTNLTDSTTFAPTVNSLSVADVAKAMVPGGALQQAQIQSIENTFIVAPEPATLLTLLPALVLFRIRSRAKTPPDSV